MARNVSPLNNHRRTPGTQMRGTIALAVALFISSFAYAAGDTRCAGDKLESVEISATAEHVAITGATPGGRVLVVSYARQWDAARSVQQLKRYEGLVHADGAGTLIVQQAGTVDGVWTVVDLESGRCGTTAGDPAGRRQKQLKRDALKLKNGKLKRLELDLTLAYWVLVRPRVGAWEMLAGDAGPHDEDPDGRPNGRTALSLDGMEAMGETAVAPDEVQPEDILLVFSPEHATMAFARVEE